MQVYVLEKCFPCTAAEGDDPLFVALTNDPNLARLEV